MNQLPSTSHPAAVSERDASRLLQCQQHVERLQKQLSGLTAAESPLLVRNSL